MNILVCDDFQIVRDGVKNMLERWNKITLVECAETGYEALAYIEKIKFDVVLLDIGLPDINGFDVLKKIKERQPTVKVIMLSIQTQTQYITRAINRNASGYLTKDILLDELKLGIEMAMKDKFYISSTIASNYAKNDDKNIEKIKKGNLSNREKEVFELLGKGYSNKEIAEMLDISEKTVSTYKSRIIARRNYKGLAELIHDYDQNKP